MITTGYRPSLPVIQRGSKKITVTLYGELAIKPDEIDQLGSPTLVTFSIEEIPLKAAEALKRHHGAAMPYFGARSCPVKRSMG